MKKLFSILGIWLALPTQAQEAAVEVTPFWQDTTFLLLAGGAVFLIIVLIIKKVVDKRRNNSYEEESYEDTNTQSEL